MNIRYMSINRIRRSLMDNDLTSGLYSGNVVMAVVNSVPTSNGGNKVEKSMFFMRNLAE